MCLLKYLDFRVLDAVFIDPQAPKSDVVAVIRSFAQSLSLDRVLIRTDGGREKGHYIQGGNSLEIDQACDLTLRIQEIKRAVILMQPTNRFTNRLAINLNLDCTGTFLIEALGPGFDVADLNRGVLNPEICITVTNVDWRTYDPPHPFFMKCTHVSVNKLRKARLNRIGSQLLPAMGIQCEGLPDIFAEKWLRENGFIGLFEEIRPKITFSQVRNYYNDAFEIGDAYRLRINWEYLVVSASDLGDGQDLVFWDISNPAEKFEMTDS